MIDTSVDIIFNSTVWFLVIWVVLAISLNIRDARKRKRLQRARQQAKTKKTVPVEQVIRLAEWNMEQWITEREKRKAWVGSSKDAALGGGCTLHTPGKCST